MLAEKGEVLEKWNIFCRANPTMERLKQIENFSLLIYPSRKEGKQHKDQMPPKLKRKIA